MAEISLGKITITIRVYCANNFTTNKINIVANLTGTNQK